MGWAYFEQGTVVEYGKYNPAGRDHFHGAKLAAFREWLLELLDKYQPTHVVVEAPYRGRNGKTYGILSMYYGVVLATYFAWSGTELHKDYTVQPRQVKLTLQWPARTDYEERKRQAVEWANRTFNLNLRFKADDKRARVSDADIADAIALVTAWILNGSE